MFEVYDSKGNLQLSATNNSYYEYVESLTVTTKYPDSYTSPYAGLPKKPDSNILDLVFFKPQIYTTAVSYVTMGTSHSHGVWCYAPSTVQTARFRPYTPAPKSGGLELFDSTGVKVYGADKPLLHLRSVVKIRDIEDKKWYSMPPSQVIPKPSGTNLMCCLLSPTALVVHSYNNYYPGIVQDGLKDMGSHFLLEPMQLVETAAGIGYTHYAGGCVLIADVI